MFRKLCRKSKLVYMHANFDTNSVLIGGLRVDVFSIACCVWCANFVSIRLRIADWFLGCRSRSFDRRSTCDGLAWADHSASTTLRLRSSADGGAAVGIDVGCGWLV